MLAGSLLISEPQFVILDNDGNSMPAKSYKVNKMRVCIGAGARAASIWRGRPEIFPWRLVCSFRYDSRRLDVDLIENIAKDAGVYPGLLDYRPERGGWYGTFDLVKIWVEE